MRTRAMWKQEFSNVELSLLHEPRVLDYRVSTRKQLSNFEKSLLSKKSLSVDEFVEVNARLARLHYTLLVGTSDPENDAVLRRLERMDQLQRETYRWNEVYVETLLFMVDGISRDDHRRRLAFLLKNVVFLSNFQLVNIDNHHLFEINHRLLFPLELYRDAIALSRKQLKSLQSTEERQLCNVQLAYAYYKLDKHEQAFGFASQASSRDALVLQALSGKPSTTVLLEKALALEEDSQSLFTYAYILYHCIRVALELSQLSTVVKLLPEFLFETGDRYSFGAAYVLYRQVVATDALPLALLPVRPDWRRVWEHYRSTEAVTNVRLALYIQRRLFLPDEPSLDSVPLDVLVPRRWMITLEKSFALARLLSLSKSPSLAQLVLRQLGSMLQPQEFDRAIVKFALSRDTLGELRLIDFYLSVVWQGRVTLGDVAFYAQTLLRLAPKDEGATLASNVIRRYLK